MRVPKYVISLKRHAILRSYWGYVHAWSVKHGYFKKGYSLKDLYNKDGSYNWNVLNTKPARRYFKKIKRKQRNAEKKHKKPPELEVVTSP